MIPWSEHQLLSFEKEALGFYITGHPLAQYSSVLKLYATAGTDTLMEQKDNAEVKIGGVVATCREITTKKGDRMGFVTLEDLKGMAEVIVFPELYQKANQLIKGEDPIFVMGNVDVDEERAKVLAKDIMLLSEVPTKLTKSVHFKLVASEAGTKQMQNLKNILGRFKGDCRAFIHLTIPDRSETVMELPKDMWVAPSLQLVSAVEKLFGHNVTYFQS
jgi:DNA polymerase-3 subunit alpha